MTRLPLQARLNRRVGPCAGLADLDDALAFAVESFGGAVVDPAYVTDADLGTVRAGSDNGLVDVAEWRMLEAICNNLTADELRKIGVNEDADRIAGRLRARLDRLAAYVMKAYGIGLPTLTLGVISLGTLQQDDPANPVINY